MPSRNWTILLAALTALLPATNFARERSDDLAAPVRIEANGKPIDHGADWGHAGPCVFDVDRDGKRDLVVGDYSGTFTFYRNVGTNARPRYESAGKLMVGNEPAEVEIWCCIGASPQFADLNGDGFADLFSGSYCPGGCYWFPGNGDGTFQGQHGEVAASLDLEIPQENNRGEVDVKILYSRTNGLPITDRQERLILRVPDQVERYQSFGSWPDTVDWDADGDLDLVIGGFDGSVWLRENWGTNKDFAFSETPIAVQAAGKPMMVESHNESEAGHAAIVAADWNGDDLFDIVAGCGDGSVRWFENVGAKGEPKFAAAEMLIGPAKQGGYGRFLEPGELPAVGIRTQVAVADMNGDGKMDLLVGDFQTTRSPRADLTPKEQAAYEKARDAHLAATEKFLAANLEVREQAKEVLEGLSKNERALDKNQDKWRKRVDELKSQPEYVALKKAYETTQKELEKYLRKGTAGFLDDATSHGFVWLFWRK